MKITRAGSWEENIEEWATTDSWKDYKKRCRVKVDSSPGPGSMWKWSQCLHTMGHLWGEKCASLILRHLSNRCGVKAICPQLFAKALNHPAARYLTWTIKVTVTYMGDSAVMRHTPNNNYTTRMRHSYFQYTWSFLEDIPSLAKIIARTIFLFSWVFFLFLFATSFYFSEMW